MDYQIQPHTRHCSVTGRELQPGERFFTALMEEDNKFVRKDYSHEAWNGPPPDAFSFWGGKVPDVKDGRKLDIDDEILIDCFHRLENQDDPRKVNFRYTVALLLMRRKRLKFEDAKQVNGQEVLVVRCPRDKKKYEVVNPQLDDEEIAAVQEEVFQVLGWES